LVLLVKEVSQLSLESPEIRWRRASTGNRRLAFGDRGLLSTDFVPLAD
jgi:hypothetical protein